MRIALLLLVVLIAPSSILAQEIVGFSREDFGKVVLLSRQGLGEASAPLRGYNIEPITNYDTKSFLFKLGGPVGRLDVKTDTRTFPCTGFLVASDLLITNYHCVPGVVNLPGAKLAGATQIEKIQFVLGYIQEGVIEATQRFDVALKPVEADEELDYSILRVSGNPAERYGLLRIASKAPIRNSPLWIIGHPLGGAQRISREQCKTNNPAISGGRLLHTCDTLPGNSGSPVFDSDSRLVVGLHYGGAKIKSVNFAMPFSRIVKRSRVLKLIATNAQVSPYNVLSGGGSQRPLPPNVNSRAILINAMQSELKRLGCYSGRVDGDWGRESQASFNRAYRARGGLQKNPSVSIENVDILRAIKKPICNQQAILPNIGRPASSGRSSCFQRAQRYCSNPDNSSAIGYQACMTQAKAGCSS